MILPVLLSLFFCFGYAYDPPIFKNGRPRDGFLGDPYVERPELLENIGGDQWFTQKLDHFDNTDIRTWKQRFYMNTMHFSGDGPVFLMIGGEGKLSSRWMSVGSMAEYGVENKALMFGLEHRFYGRSHPLNNTSVSSLRYLTSEQALSDLATFCQEMITKFKLTDKNKLIVFGGSYPGSLSAWFRYKYPHMVYGAVASSAPIKAVYDFPEYFEVSTRSLTTDECRSQVKKANLGIESLMKTAPGRAILSKKFRTCKKLTSDPNDLMIFSSDLNDNFFGTIQYNKDNRANNLGIAPINIRKLCRIMNDSKHGDEVDRYAAVNNMFLNSYNKKCVDASYENYIDYMKKTNWESDMMRQWVYQTCTEFGFFQTSDSKNQVFGTNIPIKFYTKQCEDIYGEIFNQDNNNKDITWTNSNYGAFKLGETASRIVFPNGSIDPWHALSILKNTGDVIAIFIKGSSHCANMYPSSHRDSKDLAQAKIKIGEIVKQWVQQ